MTGRGAACNLKGLSVCDGGSLLQAGEDQVRGHSGRQTSSGRCGGLAGPCRAAALAPAALGWCQDLPCGTSVLHPEAGTGQSSCGRKNSPCTCSVSRARLQRFFSYAPAGCAGPLPELQDCLLGGAMSVAEASKVWCQQLQHPQSNVYTMQGRLQPNELMLCPHRQPLPSSLRIDS